MYWGLWTGAGVILLQDGFEAVKTDLGGLYDKLLEALCPPFQSAVTEELIKWVWLGLKTVTIVKIMEKNTEKDDEFK